MACQFKQTENSNDREKFQDISVFEVRGEVGENQIDVEAESCNEVDNVYRTSDKIQNIRTGEKSANDNINFMLSQASQSRESPEREL